jgi:hypothetical protein
MKPNAIDDLNFPIADQPLVENRLGVISWGDYMDEIEPFVNHYLRTFDTAEQRLKSKIQERFVWIE